MLNSGTQSSRALTSRNDVEANHGEWAAAASARFANGVIHAFEIVAATYKYLEDVAHWILYIRPNQFGLY